MGEAKQDKRFGMRLEVISGKTGVRLYDKEGGVVYERVEKAVRCMAGWRFIRTYAFVLIVQGVPALVEPDMQQ